MKNFHMLGLYQEDTPKGDGRFIIKDWVANIMFGGIEFTTFEDAWDYIHEKFPDEDDDFYGEYYVENLKGESK